MARGIEIPFIADVARWLSGTRNVEASLERVSGSLDDLYQETAQGAERAGDALERGLEGGARDSERAVDRLDRTIQEAFDEVRRGARRAGDDLGDELSDGSREAGDSLDRLRGKMGDVADEIGQTAREGAASWSGEFDDVADVIQESLTNAAAALGPAGIAVGVAAGIGAGTFLENWKKAAEEAEQRVNDAYEDMLESGLDYLSDQAVMDRINAIVTGAEDATVQLETAERYARALNVDVADVVAAFAGSERAQERVNAAIRTQRAEAERLVNLAGEQESLTNDTVVAGVNLYDTMADIEAALRRVNTEHGRSAELVEIGRTAAERYTNALSEQEEKLRRQAEILERTQHMLTPTRPMTIAVEVDTSRAEDQLRTWRPTVRLTPQFYLDGRPVP